MRLYFSITLAFIALMILLVFYCMIVNIEKKRQCERLRQIQEFTEKKSLCKAALHLKSQGLGTYKGDTGKVFYKQPRPCEKITITA